LTAAEDDERFFDRFASTYAADFESNELASWTRDRAHRIYRDELPLFSTVVDLGCGPGVDAVFLAGLGHRVIAIDRSPRMLDEARGRVARAGARDRVTLARGDALTLSTCSEIPVGGVDAIVMGFGVVNCVPDARALLSEVASCLRPGGMVILSTLSNTPLWDAAWSLAHGRRSHRWSAEAVRIESLGQSTLAWYRSARDIERAAAGHLSLRRVWLVGTVAPPPYLDGFFRRHTVSRRLLCRLDETVAGWRPLGCFADMVWLSLRRLEFPRDGGLTE
jgi:SAM-dependent methyltransferase